MPLVIVSITSNFEILAGRKLSASLATKACFSSLVPVFFISTDPSANATAFELIQRTDFSGNVGITEKIISSKFEFG